MLAIFRLLYRVKANNANVKLDLFVNGEMLDPNDDKRLVSQVPLRDKTVQVTSLYFMTYFPQHGLKMVK